MRPSRLRLLAVLALATLLSACSLFRPKPPVYDPVVYESGLIVQDLLVPEEGLGLAPGDEVTIDYNLYLEDGALVDSTLDRGLPVTFELGAGTVPPGLEEGLLGMRLFGQRRIHVPADLGYGAEGRPPRIPPDSDLIFDVEVMHVERTARIEEEEEDDEGADTESHQSAPVSLR